MVGQLGNGGWSDGLDPPFISHQSSAIWKWVPQPNPILRSLTIRPGGRHDCWAPTGTNKKKHPTSGLYDWIVLGWWLVPGKKKTGNGLVQGLLTRKLVPKNNPLIRPTSSCKKRGFVASKLFFVVKSARTFCMLQWHGWQAQLAQRRNPRCKSPKSRWIFWVYEVGPELGLFRNGDM